MFEQMLKYGYKKFEDYEELAEEASIAEDYGWHLHSWQDVGGNSGIDIRAIFSAPYLNVKVFPLK